MTTAQNLYSLHLSTATSWRGGENQIWLLARGLLTRGQRVLVAAPRGAPLLERCREANIPTMALALRGSIDPLATLRLMALLRKERPDILHLHDGHAVLHGQLAGLALFGKKLKVVAHRRTVFDLKSRWKYNGRVDRIIAISRAVREKLIADGVSEKRICVVYSGLEFSDKLPPEHREIVNLRQACGLPNDGLLIAHAAALSAEKRQMDIIAALDRAWNNLKMNGAPSVHLALAGIGPEEDTLRREVSARALQAQVHFLGFLRDLRPLWGSSALAVFASEAEGLCTALIEAQAMGLPAVITRAGGMTEVVASEESGIVAEVGDVAGLAAGIERLCADAALRRQMGLAAEQRTRNRFGAEAMVDGVLNVYRELAE
ncbi:MAG: glycosyltransferase family 4 protein [Planctomycetota bacterium]